MKKEWNKERNEFWKERIEEKIETLKDPLPKYPEPLPVSFVTFDKIKQKYPINLKRRPKTQQKGRGFGTADRFETEEVKKWKELVSRWNAGIGDGKQLDPKKDPHPGPAQYSLMTYWPGKKVKGKRAQSAAPKET
jgi:hypothetical protein